MSYFAEVHPGNWGLEIFFDRETPQHVLHVCTIEESNRTQYGVELLLGSVGYLASTPFVKDLDGVLRATLTRLPR